MYQTLIEPEQLRALIDDAKVAVIDCRFTLKDTSYGRVAYAAGHVPGAVYAHLDDDLSSEVIAGTTGRHPLPDVGKMAALFGSWGITDGVQVVAYDDAGGMIASRVWWLLNWLGHDSVAVLNGGWQGWCELGGDISQEAFSPTKNETFHAHIRSEMVVRVDEVDARLGDESFYLFDSRTLERYRGEHEPIDPVAGRIPGARHACHEAVLGSDGKYLDSATLRKHFEGVLGDVDVSDAVFYCGSGVSAAKNLLALAHAGLGMGKLYAGSWSEWIADPARQVAHDREE